MTFNSLVFLKLYLLNRVILLLINEAIKINCKNIQHYYSSFYKKYFLEFLEFFYLTKIKNLVIQV